MPLSNGQLQDEIGVVLGTGKRADDPIRVSFQRWINQACRRIAYAYPWDEMRSDQRITTIAPYSTGTATFTQGLTALTGSGTTWTSAMVGRKVARTQGGPYYRISAFVSVTSLTLETSYADDTASGSAYVIYQDEYDIAAATHALEDVHVLDGTYWFPPLTLYGTRSLDAADYMGRSTGRPVGLALATSTTVGTPRVRLLPVPDDAHVVSLRYTRKWVSMASPTDFYTTQGLPEDVEALILDGALRWAPRVEGSRRVVSDREWRDELARVWAKHRPDLYAVAGRRRMGSGLSPRLMVNYSGLVS